MKISVNFIFFIFFSLKCLFLAAKGQTAENKPFFCCDQHSSCRKLSIFGGQALAAENKSLLSLAYALFSTVFVTENAFVHVVCTEGVTYKVVEIYELYSFNHFINQKILFV
jgi:hypothetical protein